MKKKLFISTIVLLAHTNTHSQISKEQVNDKIAGMIYLGAYADARGASTESIGTRQVFKHQFNLQQRDTWYGAHLGELDKLRMNPEGSQWGIWKPAGQFEKEDKGIITDDSQYINTVLKRYAKFLGGKKPSDDEFVAFLLGEDALFKKGEHPIQKFDAKKYADVTQNYINHISDWIGMANVAIANGKSPFKGPYLFSGVDENWRPFKRASVNFYTKDTPICFGLFMFMPLAVAYLDNDEGELIDSYYNLTKFDQGHARMVTAIMGSLITKALKKDTENLDFTAFSQWFEDESQKTLDLLREKNQREYKTIKSSLDTMIGDDREFFKGASWQRKTTNLMGARKSLGCHGVTCFMFDSAEFFASIYYTVIFTENYKEGLDMIINSAGDTDTIANLYSLLVGAFFGKKAISERFDSEVAEEVELVRKNTQEFFFVNLDDTVSSLLNYTVPKLLQH